MIRATYDGTVTDKVLLETLERKSAKKEDQEQILSTAWISFRLGLVPKTQPKDDQPMKEHELILAIKDMVKLTVQSDPEKAKVWFFNKSQFIGDTETAGW